MESKSIVITAITTYGAGQAPQVLKIKSKQSTHEDLIDALKFQIKAYQKFARRAQSAGSRKNNLLMAKQLTAELRRVEKEHKRKGK